MSDINRKITGKEQNVTISDQLLLAALKKSRFTSFHSGYPFSIGQDICMIGDIVNIQEQKVMLDIIPHQMELGTEDRYKDDPDLWVKVKPIGDYNCVSIGIKVDEQEVALTIEQVELVVGFWYSINESLQNDEPIDDEPTFLEYRDFPVNRLQSLFEGFRDIYNNG